MSLTVGGAVAASDDAVLGSSAAASAALLLPCERSLNGRARTVEGVGTSVVVVGEIGGLRNCFILEHWEGFGP